MSSALIQHGEWQSCPFGTASPSSPQGDQPCQTGLWERGLGVRSSFIPRFNRLWTPAVGAVTACYWVSVIICLLIVKWALMKRAGSPTRRLCYWRNGFQQQGQVPCMEHTRPLWATGHADNEDTVSLWFHWDHMEPHQLPDVQIQTFLHEVKQPHKSHHREKSTHLLFEYFLFQRG